MDRMADIARLVGEKAELEQALAAERERSITSRQEALEEAARVVDAKAVMLRKTADDLDKRERRDRVDDDDWNRMADAWRSEALSMDRLAVAIRPLAASVPGGAGTGWRPGWWTYDAEAEAYYFAPSTRAAPPYKRQTEVTAILDWADDGTLAGVELVHGPLPRPPGEPEA